MRWSIILVLLFSLVALTTAVDLKPGEQKQSNLKKFDPENDGRWRRDINEFPLWMQVKHRAKFVWEELEHWWKPQPVVGKVLVFSFAFMLFLSVSGLIFMFASIVMLLFGNSAIMTTLAIILPWVIWFVKPNWIEKNFRLENFADLVGMALKPRLLPTPRE